MKKKHRKTKRRESSKKRDGGFLPRLESNHAQKAAGSENAKNDSEEPAHYPQENPMKRLWILIKVFMRKDNAAEWTMAILTCAIVLLALVTTYFNFRQISISEDSAHADLRAYIGIVNPRDAWYSPNEPLLWIGIVNFGKTPANNVDAGPIFSFWKRDSLPIDPGGIKRDSLRGRFMIAPSETLQVPLRPNMGFWKRDSTSARQAFGIIYYEDHRGESHKTVFAYQWENISHSYRKMDRFNYGD